MKKLTMTASPAQIAIKEVTRMKGNKSFTIGNGGILNSPSGDLSQ